jgi:hypothetical protein
MPCARSRSVLATELDTAPAMRPCIVASASMKWFTVEPVPTPTTARGTTCQRRLADQGLEFVLRHGQRIIQSVERAAARGDYPQPAATGGDNP